MDVMTRAVDLLNRRDSGEACTLYLDARIPSSIHTVTRLLTSRSRKCGLMALPLEECSVVFQTSMKKGMNAQISR
eukprot:scaffold137080_cov21-Tisochrysis_lutea.AAC.1